MLSGSCKPRWWFRLKIVTCWPHVEFKLRHTIQSWRIWKMRHSHLSSTFLKYGQTNFRAPGLWRSNCTFIIFDDRAFECQCVAYLGLRHHRHVVKRPYWWNSEYNMHQNLTHLQCQTNGLLWNILTPFEHRKHSPAQVDCKCGWTMFRTPQVATNWGRQSAGRHCTIPQSRLEWLVRQWKERVGGTFSVNAWGLFKQTTG
jgi:hypothetical protein